jgi:aspartate 1-decarboxylase
MVQTGDVVIIMSYVQLSNDELAQHRPNVVIMGEHNRIKEVIHYEPAQTVF